MDRRRQMDTLRIILATITPGVQIQREDLERIRRRLKTLKTKFCRQFHNKLIRFFLTKSRPLILIRSVCVLFVSIESCGCPLDCTWTYVMASVNKMFTRNRGPLGHLTIIPERMEYMEFKWSKCRAVSEFGMFYRDYKCVKSKRRYNLRCLPERTYTA